MEITKKMGALLLTLILLGAGKGLQAQIINLNYNSPSIDFKVNGTVNKIITDGGMVYIGGVFSTVAGQSRNNLAAFDANGNLTTWNPNVNGEVKDLVKNGNNIYLAGSFSSVGGQSRNNLASVNASNGSITPWNPNPNGSVTVLAIKDTTLYASGSFSQVGGKTRSGLVAFGTNSGLVTTWNPNPNDVVYCILPSDTTVFLGGEFTTLAGQTRNHIAEVKASGGNVTTFNPNAVLAVRCMGINDGKLYVGGDFYQIAGQFNGSLVAFDLATKALQNFNAFINGSVYGLAFAPGSIIFSGVFDSFFGQNRQYLAAYNLSSNSPSYFDPEPSDTVKTILYSDAVLYVGGKFETIEGNSQNYLAYYDYCTLTTPTISVSGPTTFCQGGSVTLTVSGGNNFHWSDGSTANPRTITTSGRYLVQSISGRCSSYYAGPIGVTVNPLPVATVTAVGPTTICPGEVVTLKASGGSSVQNLVYSLSPVVSDGPRGFLDGQNTGGTVCDCPAGYVAVGYSGAADTWLDNIKLACKKLLPDGTLDPNIVYTSLGGNPTSNGTTITALGTGNNVLKKFQGIVDNVNIGIVVLNAANTTITDAALANKNPSGGDFLTELQSTVFTDFSTSDFSSTALFSPDSSVITGLRVDNSGPNNSVGLLVIRTSKIITQENETGAGDYIWSNGATTRSITVSSPGSYTVSALGNGCTSTITSPIVVSLKQASIAASGPTTFCTGGSVTLTASGGTSYLWSDGNTTNPRSVSTSGTYTVQAISNSCSSAASMATVVTVNTCGNSWTGSTSTDWATPANWSAGSLPTSSTDVTITSAQRNPVIASTVSIKSLTISSGVNLTVSGTLNIAGNLVNNGTVSGSGTLKLNGSNQSISGTAFDVANLHLAHTGTATLNSSVGVSGTVTLASGTLNANGNLVLRSNASGTGLIDDFSPGNGGSISGTIKAERYFPVSGLHLVAAPVTGSALGTLGLACSDIRFWSEALNVGVVASNGCETTAFDVNTPLAVTENSGTKYTLSGTANTGDYSYNLVRGAGSTPQRGFNYVANPYPSPISWTAVAATSGVTTNSNGTAYIWNPSTSTYGSVSSTGVITGSANNLIQPGQGFIVRRSNVGTTGATMTFKNSHRVNTNAAFFIRKPVTDQALRLVLKSNNSEDDILLYTSAEAKVDADHLDAEKLHSHLPVASISSGNDLAINALPTDFNGSVALNISAPEAGVYKLSVKELGEVNVNLEDKKTGTFTVLTPETNMELNLNETNEGRFALHYGSCSAGSNKTQIFAADKLVTVILPEAANAVIEAVNTLGQVVSTINGNEKITRFALPHDGVYVIRVKSSNGVKSGKVVY